MRWDTLVLEFIVLALIAVIAVGCFLLAAFMVSPLFAITSWTLHKLGQKWFGDHKRSEGFNYGSDS